MSSGLPRHASRRNSEEPLAPALWASREAAGPGVWGAYPKGFVRWACRLLGVSEWEVLHVCAGSLGTAGLASVDIRPEACPSVVADGRALPFREDSVPCVMLDPPYTEQYAADLYGTEYPRPSHLLAEAARVVRPGGQVAMLHFIVHNPPPGCAIERVEGVTLGCGYAIRAFTVYRKRDADLFEGWADD